MKAGNNQIAKTNSRKGLKWTLGIHSALLIIGMIPLASNIEITDKTEYEYVIPIEFAEFAQSKDEGLKAKSPVPDPEPKPVVEQEEVEPDIVEAETISEVAQVTEEVEEVISEVVEETIEEVVASEDDMVADAEETMSEGGSNVTLEEGETEGTDTAGEDEGQSGIGGDGIITRKIIYRQDITQAAVNSGKIVVDMCIDRSGKVLAVANNEGGTTITDMDMVRQALNIVVEYRFEVDYTAAKKECGQLTIIFDLEADGGYAQYAMVE